MSMPQTALAQETDKDGDREERSTPSQPTQLRLYEATHRQGDLEISFTHGQGATIHEVQLLRSDSGTGTYSESGEPILTDSSPQGLGNQDLDYWYQAKVRACDDDDDCSAYVESNNVYLPMLAPPHISRHQRFPRPREQHRYRQLDESHLTPGPTRTGSRSCSKMARIRRISSTRKPSPGTSASTMVTLTNAWGILGAGPRRVRARTCNTQDECSLGNAASLNMVGPTNIQITPNPLPLGLASEEWEVPFRVNSLFVDIQTTGTADTDAGTINLTQIDIYYEYATTPVAPEEGTTSLTLDWHTGRAIRIEADPDAFNNDGSDINLTFHYGTSTEGVVMARATIQGQARPATPTPATTPSTLDPITSDLTLNWNAGTQPAGARHDHYLAEIQELGPELKTSMESITIPDADDEISAGAHNARVRSCNNAGGCSTDLEIPFMIANPGPKIRVRELDSEVSTAVHQEFRMEAFNPGGRCPGNDQYESGTFTPTGTSHTETEYLRSCRETTGTLTVELIQEGESVPLDQYQEEITVRQPRMVITGLDQELENGNSINITMSVSGLMRSKPHIMQVSSSSYRISIRTTAERTPPYCSSYFPLQEIPQGTTAFTMPLFLQACGEEATTIRAEIWEQGPTAPYVVSQSFSLTVGPPAPITVTGLTSRQEIPDGSTHQVTISGSGLDPTAIYTLTGDNLNIYDDYPYDDYPENPEPENTTATIGFDEECSERQERTLAGGTTSFSETFTIKGCIPLEQTIRFTLEGDNGDLESTIIDIIVAPAPDSTAGPPTDLDVTPLPEREAMISWTAPDGAAPDTEYTVEWAPSPASPDVDWTSLGTAEGTGLTIKLYPHLINHDSFAVRVRAGTGEPSEAVIIVDSPITQADGDSRGATSPAGKRAGEIEIQWPEITGATTFKAKIREFDIDNDGNWSYSDNSHVHASFATLENISSPHTINPVQNLTTVAIQLIYEKDGKKVYSGTDIYAAPNTASRTREELRTFPLLKIDRKYPFRVCMDSFTPHADAWVKLTEEAIGQWETATDHLVTTTPLDHENCADYTKFISAIEERLKVETAHPIEAVDELLDALYRSKAIDEVLQKDFQQNDIRGISLKNPANTFLYKQGMNDIGGQFHQSVGDFNSLMSQPKLYGAHSAGNYQKFGRDILVGIPFEKPEIPANPSEVQFGTCKPMYREDGEPHVYAFYSTLVHEAGHNFGVRGFQGLRRKVNNPEYHHPYDQLTIDSVMNYGTISIEKGAPIGNCSPSPLDIMAMYAMFQTE